MIFESNFHLLKITTNENINGFWCKRTAHMINQKPLKKVDPSFFEQDSNGVFDFIEYDIADLPYIENYVQSITKARFTRCNLTTPPKNIGKYINLKSLDLSDNKISQFEEDNFINLESLQSLDLSMNSIRNITVSLPNLITDLDISYNPGLNIYSIWRLPLPLESLHINACRITQLPDFEPKWSSTIKTITLECNFLKTIPDYIWNFPCLEEVSFFGNNIESVNIPDVEKTFKGMNFSFNNIKSFNVSDRLIIQGISLNATLLDSIPVQAMLSCNLRVLSLNKAKLSGILDFEFPHLLSIFDISHNSITGFTDKVIESCAAVSVFNASFNNISEIPDKFPEKLCLSQILLNHNNLTTLPSTLLQAKTLEKLIASNNFISSIPDFRLPQLREINLSFNRLKSIPDCFSSSSFLLTVNIAMNQLTDLPHSFSVCRKIKDFNASGNLFVQVPQCILSFAALHTLFLSGNRLTALPGSFSSFFFMKHLDISNNHFIEFPTFLDQLFQLRTLSIAHNLISSIPDTLKLPQTLGALDFSYNLLETFPDFQLPNLTSLCLDSNKISTITLTNLPELQYLSLSGNNISSLDVTPLHKLQSLEIFGNPELKELTANDDCVIMRDSYVFLEGCPYGFGISSTIGERPTMEDAISAFTDPTDHSLNLFGVFDGHAGSLAAEIAARDFCHYGAEFAPGRIPIDEGDLIPGSQVISQVCGQSSSPAEFSSKFQTLLQIWRRREAGLETEFLEDSEMPPAPEPIIEQPITDGFPGCFWRLQKRLIQSEVSDGCTVAAVMIFNGIVQAAGIGDSRIVLVKKDRAERLTTDAKPLIKDEFDRLKAAGFGVSCDGRVRKKLAVSRSLGDFWCGGGLYVNPEIKEFPIGEDDIALIIACDGLWDVIGDEDAANIVRKAKCAQEAASALKNYALCLGSKDNVSVLVITFNPEEGDKGYVIRNTIERLPIVKTEVEEPLFKVPPNPRSSRRRR